MNVFIKEKDDNFIWCDIPNFIYNILIFQSETLLDI